MTGISRQIGQYGIAVIVPAAVTLVSTAVFTRVLPAVEFGRYSLVMSLVTVLTGLGTPWLEQAVLRYLPAATDRAQVASLLGGLAAGLVAVAGVALVLGITSLLVLPSVLPPEWSRLIVPSAAALIVLGLLSPLNTLQQAKMEAGRYARYRVLESVTRLGVAVVMVFEVARAAGSLVWAQVASSALVVPLLWREGGLPVWRELRAKWRTFAPTVAQFARYGFPLVGFSWAATLLDAGDRYVIQFTRGTVEVGIYTANYGLAYGGALFGLVPVLMAAHPLLMRAWGAGDHARAADWLGRIVVSVGVVGAGATAAVWLLAPNLAAVFLGPEFREGYVVMAPVFAAAVAWQTGMYTHKPLEFAGRTGVMFGAGLTIALVNLALNLVLVPRYGYVAAAYTTLACYLAYAALMFPLGRRHVAWRFDLRPILATILTAGALAVGTAWAARGAPPLAALILKVLGAGVVGLGVPLLVLRRYDATTLGRALHL